MSNGSTVNSLSHDSRTFKSISREFPVLLLDTSVLYSGGRFAGRSFDKLLKKSLENRRQAAFLRGFIESGNNFYVTEMVLDQYRAALRMKKKDRIKRGGDNVRVDLIKQKEEEHREMRKLVDLLVDTDRIVKLEGVWQEHYQRLVREYPWLPMQYGLSKTSADFVFTGVALSQRTPTTVLFSNRGIGDSLRELFRKGEYGGRELRRFYRAGNIFRDAA